MRIECFVFYVSPNIRMFAKCKWAFPNIFLDLRAFANQTQLRTVAGVFVHSLSYNSIKVLKRISSAINYLLRRAAFLPRPWHRESEEDPKKIRQRYLEEQRSCTLGGYSSPFDIAQLRRKEPFWFITKHGPFRHHLAKMNKKHPSVCRFCVRRLEDADHLLHDCDELGPSHYTSIAEFEERCQAIARQIFSSGD